MSRRADRPLAGRPNGRKSTGLMDANSLLQASACCATASSLLRDGRTTEAMDQAKLAMRFLRDVTGEQQPEVES